MLRHLFKLIWKRKSRNLMLSLELLLAFVIVFAIAAFAARSYQLFHLPVGFQHEQMWSVRVETRDDQGFKSDPGAYAKFRQSLAALPEVEQVAFANFPLYSASTMRSTFSLPDGSHAVTSDMLNVSDEFQAVGNIVLQQGHWFSQANDGAAEIPVVINARLAAQLFPGKSALGQVFRDIDLSGKSPDFKPDSYRVSGVIEDFRNKGEYMTPVNFVLQRFQPGVSKDHLRTLLIRVRPGTTRAFESTLNRQLTLVHNDWNYEITPVSDARASTLRTDLIPLLVLSVIAAFLLVMVAFGLFGVLWQNTTQRIPEIGLRRAVGADAGHIYRQIVAEQLLLSSGAIAVALLLLVQLPLTGVLGESLNWPVFLCASALSAGVIYLLSLLCSLYPGWRAARLSPTQALHDE